MTDSEPSQRPGWQDSDLPLVALVVALALRLPEIADPWLPAYLSKAALLLAAGSVLAARVWRTRRFPAGSRRLLLFVAPWAAVCLASGLWAGDRQAWWEGLAQPTRAVLIALLVAGLTDRPRSLRRGLQALTAAGLWLGSISVLQFALRAWGERFLGFADVLYMELGRGVYAHRAEGSFGDPNYFAQFLVVPIALALERMLRAPGRPWWTAAMAASTLMMASLARTYSRGGYLALVVVLLLLSISILRSRPPWSRVLVLAAVLAIGTLAALPKVGDRLAPVVDLVPRLVSTLPRAFADPPESTRQWVESEIRIRHPLRGRLRENATAVMMFLDHPVGGVGFAQFILRYPDYAERLGRRQPRRSAHSLYLEVAAETGTLGLLAFVFFLLGLFTGLTSAARIFGGHQPDMSSRTVALGIGMVGFFVAALFLHQSFYSIFWLLMGLSFGAPAAARGCASPPPRR